MAKEIPFNLFGWNDKGVEVTNELRAILKRYGWEEIFDTKQPLHFLRKQRTSLHFISPKKFGKKVLWLHDNGGEVNLGWGEEHGEFRDIPTTYFDEHLNARTFYYRLVQTLAGKPIDYEKKIGKLTIRT